MAKMSPRDRNQLQHIQEGLSGTKPMDLAWIDATVAALKSNPKIFKSMVKGKGAMMGKLFCIAIQNFLCFIFVRILFPSCVMQVV